jgi:hypothetical protein
MNVTGLKNAITSSLYKRHATIFDKDGAWETAVCGEKSTPYDKNSLFGSHLHEGFFVHFRSQCTMKKKTSKKKSRRLQ